MESVKSQAGAASLQFSLNSLPFQAHLFLPSTTFQAQLQISLPCSPTEDEISFAILTFFALAPSLGELPEGDDVQK